MMSRYCFISSENDAVFENVRLLCKIADGKPSLALASSETSLALYAGQSPLESYNDWTPFFQMPVVLSKHTITNRSSVKVAGVNI
jgi:hypothetical protein